MWYDRWWGHYSVFLLRFEWHVPCTMHAWSRPSILWLTNGIEGITAPTPMKSKNWEIINKTNGFPTDSFGIPKILTSSSRSVSSRGVVATEDFFIWSRVGADENLWEETPSSVIGVDILDMLPRLPLCCRRPRWWWFPVESAWAWENKTLLLSLGPNPRPARTIKAHLDPLILDSPIFDVFETPDWWLSLWEKVHTRWVVTSLLRKKIFCLFCNRPPTMTHEGRTIMTSLSCLKTYTHTAHTHVVHHNMSQPLLRLSYILATENMAGTLWHTGTNSLYLVWS